MTHSKPRVTLDATRSGINAAQPPWPFQYAGPDDVTNAVKPGWWLAKLDLKGYYNQLLVHPDSQELLGVRWKGKSYVYTSVPFGVSLACAFASWVSAELSEAMRARGIAVVISYIDDFLFAAATEELCAEALRVALELLQELGVKVAPGKTEGPAQRLEFLGVEYDTVAGATRISPRKQQKLSADLLSASTASVVTAHVLCSLAGKLLWFSQVRPYLKWWAQHLWAAVSEHRGTGKAPSRALRVALKGAAKCLAESEAALISSGMSLLQQYCCAATLLVQMRPAGTGGTELLL